eukprot:UN32773
MYGAYGFISCGKTMITDVFQLNLPLIVTSTFCATFVAGMSASNMSGRLIFSNLSDYVISKSKHDDPFWGRRATFTGILGAAPLCYLSVMWAAHNVEMGALPLYAFCGVTWGILLSFGGSVATRPAYAGDIFGMQNVAAFTARQLSVVLPAAFAGPKITSYIRDKSISEAIHDLTQKISDEDFFHHFSTTKDHLEELITNKSITISRLMDILPPGTDDPTKYIYDHALWVFHR